MSPTKGLRAVRYSRGLAALAAFSAIAGVASGCGGTEERNSEPRPPIPINIAVKIGDDRVAADPKRFGAGPIVLVASNQSTASHRLTVDGPQLRQSVGPINPQDTARLQVNVKPGEYTLAADGSTSVQPAKLSVGPQRETAQNELLQP